MFIIYHSNHLHLLKKLAVELIKNFPLRDPFQAEIILIQNSEMSQWIQMELAKSFGIAANIDFSLPGKFIWKMFTHVLSNIPDENIFSKKTMTWILMTILQRVYKQPNCKIIEQYLCDDGDQRKQFQFATQVAKLFEQYLIFRPNWLERWQHGKLVYGLGEEQHWQAQLWKTLMEKTEKITRSRWNFANLNQRFIQTLEEKKTVPPGLPNRIFIFGISILPPAYIETLQSLGNHIDIHLLFSNPCRYYWGDIPDHAFLTHLTKRTRRHYQKKSISRILFQLPKKTCSLFNYQEKQKLGNPLLSSWGTLGRDTLQILSKLNDVQEVDAFVEPNEQCLLSILQRDILQLENHAVDGITKKTLKTNQKCKRPLHQKDCSISIHICHSPHREIEILHDNLLTMMKEDPSLCPGEIIVMVADIEQYIPAIEAVFGNILIGRSLPFAISDRCARNIHPVLSAFLSLLELPRTRSTTEQILTLLEVPAIGARFSISMEELHLLRSWIGKSGVRWGLDDDTLRALMLPVTGQHTWQFGLARMLLGYAMNSQYGDWQGILPYDESNGILVGHLAELILLLRRWRDYLTQPRTLEEWLPCAREMIEDFFSPDLVTESALLLIVKHWHKILQYGLKTDYDQPVPFSLLHEALSIQLDQEKISQNFLTGAINFCNLTPLRSIPFKVVCLLGMNDGIYPRMIPPIHFNLINLKRQCGDHKWRDEDRYSFLQSLLSAQQRLYISFIGRSIQDNTPRYPSVLVSELSDYITQSFYLTGDEKLNAEKSIARVRDHLWQWHTRIPYAEENFIPNSKHQSFANEWLTAAKRKGNPQPDFITKSLVRVAPEILPLEEFWYFYSHPVRAWFQKRLAIFFQKETLTLETYEPFVLDGMSRYQLNDRLVNTLINRQDPNALYRQVFTGGLLPYGAFGKLYWNKQREKMEILAKQVLQFLLPERKTQEVILNIGDIKLTGCLIQVQNNGLVRWRPGNLSIKDGLQLWLQHLVYCAIGGRGESRMFGTQGHQWHFASLSAQEAKTYLFSLVNGYCQGMSLPLLLLNRSGEAWLTHCFDRHTGKINWEKNLQQHARNKLIQSWKGNSVIPGEGKDLYFQRLIPSLNESHITTIIQVTEHYLLPPFKLNLAV